LVVLVYLNSRDLAWHEYLTPAPGRFKAHLIPRVLYLSMPLYPPERTSNHGKGPSRNWKKDIKPDDPAFEDARVDDLVIVLVISSIFHKIILLMSS
jgi:hypothetical protein